MTTRLLEQPEGFAVPRDPRFDILFEPLQIGPVTARNRFFQVPHCNGMGWTQPRGLAELRRVKAEGGWGVICTEEVEIHPSSDCSPFHEGRLWSDLDIAALALMTEAVHAHGALAGIEIMHHGPSCANHDSREIPLGPSHRPITHNAPVQARAMSRQDIRELRHWHRQAALRARRADFDIVYVYASHDLGLPMHFLQRRKNDRTDEYGGSLENRVRLLRELIEDTRDAVGDRCAVAVRLGVEELLGPDGIVSAEEGRDIIAMLAELPDLWDVNVSSWGNDSVTSRFVKEGYQEQYTAFVKSLTSKPVVGVGRFTSPDTMVSQIRRGVMDFIGAARPSIADPFLPNKIAEGRLDDIRECIGCNICVSSDYSSSNLRCTQNPTMGEEWRRGWHPEKIAPRGSDNTLLVVGAGPAGLEAALAAARRGYEVHLAEAGSELGGRVLREASLPGLREWSRVRDWRVGQLLPMSNVSIYRQSPLSAGDILEFGAGHVAIATGSHWRRDGVGRANGWAIPGFDSPQVLTPDDLMGGRLPTGPVVIFDDDHYYMGNVLAERCVELGLKVTLVTPALQIAGWTDNTLEASRILKRLMTLEVELVRHHNISRFEPGNLHLRCEISGRPRVLECQSLVSVTARLPDDALHAALLDQGVALAQAGIGSVSLVGDSQAPGTIAAAVYQGHKFARYLDSGLAPHDYARELPLITPGPVPTPLFAQ
ncbi:oxidoreductase [Pseudomonas gingeri]|uniref:oxidoreductase n=1 Tax=Pseudomonas gingeri TaxID=117681 RepID=UPI0002D4EC09|nr:NAD(P)-binding protein [Pseudomonas gingeri]NWE49492.1 NAD(P)-binding protein [Pseudomonas gingeri]NWE70350.1 NAD(P)-binding protein [Pseudomonas gingeri]